MPSLTAEEWEDYKAYWGDLAFRTPEHCPMCLRRECTCEDDLAEQTVVELRDVPQVTSSKEKP